MPGSCDSVQFRTHAAVLDFRRIYVCAKLSDVGQSVSPVRSRGTDRNLAGHWTSGQNRKGAVQSRPWWANIRAYSPSGNGCRTVWSVDGDRVRCGRVPNYCVCEHSQSAGRSISGGNKIGSVARDLCPRDLGRPRSPVHAGGSDNSYDHVTCLENGAASICRRITTRRNSKRSATRVVRLDGLPKLTRPFHSASFSCRCRNGMAR
jgi:hypothetical protein